VFDCVVVGASAANVVKAIMEEEFRSVARLDVEVHEDVDPKCLKRSPLSGLQSAKRLSSTLEATSGAQPAYPTWSLRRDIRGIHIRWLGQGLRLGI
jgi:hypothetical protein